MKTFTHETVEYGIAYEELVARLIMQGCSTGLCSEDQRSNCETEAVCLHEMNSINSQLEFCERISKSKKETEEEAELRKEEALKVRKKVAVGAFKCCVKFTFKDTKQIIQEGSITPEQFKRFGRKVDQSNGQDNS